MTRYETGITRYEQYWAGMGQVYMSDIKRYDQL